MFSAFRVFQWFKMLPILMSKAFLCSTISGFVHSNNEWLSVRILFELHNGHILSSTFGAI